MVKIEYHFRIVQLNATQNDPPLQRERIHATISAEIERRILSNEIAVGEKLPSESALAKEFGVSTRSIREALQTLETKGLVQRRHGGLTTVIRSDVDEFLGTLAVSVRQRFANDPDYFLQLMETRRMLEMEVAGMIISPCPAGIDILAEALQEMEKAKERSDFEAFVNADAIFHQSLIRLSKNNVITTIYDNLFDLVNDVIQVSSRIPSKPLQQAYEEHRHIFHLLRDGHGEQAKSVLKMHIENSAAYLEVALHCR